MNNQYQVLPLLDNERKNVQKVYGNVGTMIPSMLANMVPPTRRLSHAQVKAEFRDTEFLELVEKEELCGKVRTECLSQC
jgi:hypothetical protein